MNTKRLLSGVLVLAVAGLTSVVIGRYGDAFAGFLRPDVLIGFGVIATLVALITLEYRAEKPRQSIGSRIDRQVGGDLVGLPAPQVVPMWQATEDERKAA